MKRLPGEEGAAGALRATLMKSVASTANVRSSKLIEARQQARAVYLETLPTQTKAEMLKSAQMIWTQLCSRTLFAGRFAAKRSVNRSMASERACWAA